MHDFSVNVDLFEKARLSALMHYVTALKTCLGSCSSVKMRMDRGFCLSRFFSECLETFETAAESRQEATLQGYTGSTLQTERFRPKWNEWGTNLSLPQPQRLCHVDSSAGGVQKCTFQKHNAATVLNIAA